jgi:(p)ppGpp synthase/HD superfamily hydrolase
MVELVAKAGDVAAEAHKDHKRKGSGDPYFVHPYRVSQLVSKHVSPAAIAAALLHDVIEDTDVRSLSQFPLRVRQLVRLLTRCPDESKDDMIDRIGKSMDVEGILIKVCDRIDNLTDGVDSFGPRWLKKYAKGGWRIAKIAKEAGLVDHPLVRRLRTLVTQVDMRVHRQEKDRERSRS